MATAFSRRSFLLGVTATGGLIAGGWAGQPYAKRLYRRAHWIYRKTFPAQAPIAPAAFLSVDPDGTVTLLSKHLEMGQGVMTGLATLVAEEMDADWAQLRSVHAPADKELYQNLIYPTRQVTAASSSIRNSWQQMRLIGAGARAMFVGAAAEKWGVSTEGITVEKGLLRHAQTGQEAGFGDLAAEAMQRPAPDSKSLPLKDPADWTLIGGDQERLEADEKLSGRTEFSLDTVRPDMLRATVLRAPRFGGRLKQFDASAALALPGVKEVIEIPTGVAVMAEDTWTAIKARGLITADWDDSEAETRSSEEMFADYEKLAATPGTRVPTKPEVADPLEGAEYRETLEFRFDYLPHAPMEPLNAVMERSGKGVTIWASCQAQTLEQEAVSRAFGCAPEQVVIHTQYAGSSFGRRVFPQSDWLPELAEVVKASALDRPVQLIWTREDDLTGGAYRPQSVHRAELGFDEAGKLTGWQHRVVCQSLTQGSPWQSRELDDGWDHVSVMALMENPYGIANFRLEAHNPVSPVTVGFWRSVGDAHNGQALETVIDIVAHRAGVDPLAYRRDRLKDHPEMQSVLDAVAKASNWAIPVPPGRGRGVSVMADSIYGQDTAVAMVAEVSQETGRIAIERITVAVDCGIVINPDIVRSQIEGSIAFALSGALRRGLTFDKGLVEQTNFDRFEPTRMSDMPELNVIILPSARAPSGIGEAAVAPVSPAIGNAIFAATGQRQHSLPYDLG